MHVNFKTLQLVFYIFLMAIKTLNSTIDGLSYMNSLSFESLRKKWPRGEDPCTPLYWYPKGIPEYCYYRNRLDPNIKPSIPQPLLPSPLPMPIPIPISLPFGVPIAPTNPMLPVAGIPFHFPSPLYSYHYPSSYNPTQMNGMIPGLPGLVTRDGSISILPFSDAYSDMLEKHKQKVIRKRLQKILDRYEHYKRY